MSRLLPVIKPDFPEPVEDLVVVLWLTWKHEGLLTAAVWVENQCQSCRSDRHVFPTFEKKKKEMLQKHKGCDSWGLLEVFCHMTQLCHSINAKSSQSLLTLPASYLFSASFAQVSEIFPRLFWLILVTSFQVIYNRWRRAWSSKKASYKCRHSGGLRSGGWLLN